MIVVNSNNHEVSLNAEDYKERSQFASSAVNMLSDKKINDLKNIAIPPNETAVFELK